MEILFFPNENELKLNMPTHTNVFERDGADRSQI